MKPFSPDSFWQPLETPVHHEVENWTISMRLQGSADQP